MRNSIHTRLAGALFVALLFPASRAAAIDLQPGEIAAPPPGIRIVQTSLVYNDFGKTYRNGVKLGSLPEGNSLNYQIRLGQSFEVAGMPAFAYAQTQAGYTHVESSPGNLDGDTGFTDTALLLALWPYCNRESETYFALGAYLMLPTGSYDNERLINRGENRYRTALQAGFQTRLVDGLHLATALDALHHGDNDDYTAGKFKQEKDMLYTLQLGLRYDFSRRFALAGNYFVTEGGNVDVEGVEISGNEKLRRYQLSGVLNLPFGRLTLQYGGDISRENGTFEEHRTLLRFMTQF